MRRLAIVIATVGGVGYAPVASGTLGSLVAVPLLPALAALRGISPLAYVAVVAAVIGLAVWSAGVAEESLGGHDHSTIVIDEVAGQVVAGAILPGTWLAAGLAFVLFRVFDVVKPPPAAQIDGQIEGGFGVVGDDLVAGAYAGAVAWLVLRFL